MICYTLLLPLIILVDVILTIARQIVQTICSWVSTVISTIKQVVQKVCDWLPWPLDSICNWVTTAITVLETVWNWVCNTVISWVFDVINYFFQFIIWLVRVICIIVTVIISLPGLLLCSLGLRVPAHIRVSIKVITDNEGNSKVTDAAVQQSKDLMRKVYEQCDIRVEFDGVERVAAPDLLVTADAWWGLFAPWHAKYAALTFGCCNQVTVFFIDTITGTSNGLTYWGDNWCRVDSSANNDPTIMAHEVGHICNLWHDSSNTNLMFANSGPPTNPRNTLSGFQCCWMRTSPFIMTGRGGGPLG